MQSLLELQQSAGSSFEFIESVKSDLFPDEIYVFTPEGRIVELPAAQRRSTSPTRCIPISAMPASRASTDSLIRCRSRSPAARRWKLLPRRAHVRTRLAELCRQLKARAKIRQLLKNLKRDDSVSLGRRLLNHALGGSRKLAEIPPENIQRELDRMKLASLDDLLAEIGLGNAMSVVVAKNLQQGEASRHRAHPATVICRSKARTAC
jgi:guanosine-3',5'-bis(diphosphate) 3'-pyrophosphohydrolase